MALIFVVALVFIVIAIVVVAVLVMDSGKDKAPKKKDDSIFGSTKK